MRTLIKSQGGLLGTLTSILVVLFIIYAIFFCFFVDKKKLDYLNLKKKKSKLKVEIIGACWCNLWERKNRGREPLHHHHKYSVGLKKKKREKFTMKLEVQNNWGIVRRPASLLHIILHCQVYTCYYLHTRTYVHMQYFFFYGCTGTAS